MIYRYNHRHEKRPREVWYMDYFTAKKFQEFVNTTNPPYFFYTKEKSSMSHSPVYSAIVSYFLHSFCLKALRSRPSCAKLCRLTVKVKAVLSSWVNGLSAPQNGKSGWGNPLRLKNDIY